MSSTIRIALVGFTAFERAHIEACLRGGRRDGGDYQLSDSLPGCGLVVCNADDETAAAQVQQQGRLAGCVMLGTLPRAGAAIQLARPVSPARLLHALQLLADAAPAMSADARRVQDELARITTFGATVFADTLHSTTLMSLPTPLDESARRKRTRPDHILVIDSDDGVLRFVAEHVQRFGFEVHLARSAGEGLARVKRRHFEVVLLALAACTSAGDDWAATCKAAHHTPRAGRAAPPSVVLLLEPGAELDWLHAEIAGVDGWLHKPLQADELLGVIGQRELLMRPDLQTTHSASLFG